MRMTYLAERSGLTRQAFSAVVDELERLGIVACVDAPDDPRVRLVTYTGRGRERFAIARGLMWDMEADYRAPLGDDGYAALRAGLQAVIDQRR
jgi:DNA-binding MarR family transcriptional regulator